MKRMFCMIACVLGTMAVFGQQKAPETASLHDKMMSASVMAIADVSINPNPVVSGDFSLAFQNLQKGKYHVYLYDTSGKRFLLKTVEFDGGSAVLVLSLPAKVNAGVYILQVVSKAARFSRKLLVN